MNDLEEIILYRLYKRKLERRRRVKRLWSIELFIKRHEESVYAILMPQLKEDQIKFQNYCRMEKRTFQKLLGMIEVVHNVNNNNFNVNRTICIEERLMVTLRYYATGNSFSALQYNFRMSPSTISKIISSMSKTIFMVLKKQYIGKPTEKKWKQIAQEYLDYRQIPLCVGSIDGKHIRVQKPRNGGSLYYNYKNFHSLVLLAVVDANYIFTIIDVGACGSANDNAVFRNSSFGKLFFANQLDFPKADPFPNETEPYPYFFISDEAFPLSSNIMRPYTTRNVLSDNADRMKKEIFNYRLSRARLNVECAFGMLHSKFRIFDTPFLTDVPKTIDTVQATCALHNFIRLEDRPHVNESDVSAAFRTSRLSRKNLFDISHQTSNTGALSFDAVSVREHLANYFISSAGEVPWQNQKIMPTNFS